MSVQLEQAYQRHVGKNHTKVNLEKKKSKKIYKIKSEIEINFVSS